MPDENARRGGVRARRNGNGDTINPLARAAGVTANELSYDVRRSSEVSSYHQKNRLHQTGFSSFGTYRLEFCSTYQNCRSTGTVHVRQGTYYQCRDLDLDHCSSAHCQPSLIISCKSVQKFSHKVANRQTTRQRRLQSYPPWCM